MARIISVTLNERDMFVVQEDGAVFMLVMDAPTAEGSTFWLEIEPVPRTPRADQQEAQETRERVRAAGLFVPEVE